MMQLLEEATCDNGRLLKEEQLAVNLSLLYSIKYIISIIGQTIHHADLDSNSSFMEPEWGCLHVSSIILLFVDTCTCNLYQALF